MRRIDAPRAWGWIYLKKLANYTRGTHHGIERTAAMEYAESRGGSAARVRIVYDSDYRKLMALRKAVGALYAQAATSDSPFVKKSLRDAWDALEKGGKK